MTVQGLLHPTGTLPQVSAGSLHMVEQDKYGGGQATVHQVRWGERTCLFKHYDEPGAADPGHLARVRLLAGPEPQPAGLAVPLALVEESGDTVGYLMAPAPDRYLDGEEPRYLSMLGSDDHGYTAGQRLAVLGALLDRILDLHDAGVVIGDLKSRNIFIVDPDHLSAPGGSDPVFIVDCDSFAFTDDPPATQPYTDHMLPAQWYGRQLSRQTDLYQFALLAERALTGDFSLPADQEPLHPDVRNHIDDWHWRVLNEWKSLAPPSAGSVTRGDAAALAAAWRLRWAEPDISVASSAAGQRPAAGPPMPAPHSATASAEHAPQATRRRRTWIAALVGLAIAGAMTAFAAQQGADAAGPPASGESVWIGDVDAGACIDDPVLESDEPVGEVQVVACTELHNGEVVGQAQLPQSVEYPGDAVISEQAEAACLTLFDQYTGQEVENSPYGLTWFQPTESGWEGGDRAATCVGYEPDGRGEIESRTGSIRG